MNPLVKTARERIADTPVQTHSEGCHKWHAECLIQRLADAVERLELEARQASASWAEDCREKERLAKELEAAKESAAWWGRRTAEVIEDKRKSQAELAEARGLLGLTDSGAYALALQVRDLAADRDRLEKDLQDVAEALPGVAYMDPPDGGSPSVAEQVQRMYADLRTQVDVVARLAAERDLWRRRAEALGYPTEADRDAYLARRAADNEGAARPTRLQYAEGIIRRLRNEGWVCGGDGCSGCPACYDFGESTAESETDER